MVAWTSLPSQSISAFGLPVTSTPLHVRCRPARRGTCGVRSFRGTNLRGHRWLDLLRGVLLRLAHSSLLPYQFVSPPLVQNLPGIPVPPRLGRLCQAPLWRSRTRFALSRRLYPSRSDLQPQIRRPQQRQSHLSLARFRPRQQEEVDDTACR